MGKRLRSMDKHSFAYFRFLFSKPFFSMDESMFQQFMKMAGLRFQAHPWHGIEIGPKAPEVVSAFIEIIPSDTVKYEIDKASGHLKVDRPQKFSNIVPALYAIIVETFRVPPLREGPNG